MKNILVDIPVVSGTLTTKRPSSFADLPLWSTACATGQRVSTANLGNRRVHHVLFMMKSLCPHFPRCNVALPVHFIGHFDFFTDAPLPLLRFIAAIFLLSLLFPTLCSYFLLQISYDP